jgi:hypothetical protein
VRFVELRGANGDSHKTVVLRDGPLDGEVATIPAYTVALIVFADDQFHRYSLGAADPGPGGALGYTGPVPLAIAGFRPFRRHGEDWGLDGP